MNLTGETMQIESFSNRVKENCNISDARYWGYFSICNLLLRLRDLYHQEHSLLPWEKSETAVVSRWIQDREAMWEKLEEEPFRPLVVGGESCDPFDIETINKHLIPQGFLYGAGYGLLKKPNFFLSRIERSLESDDHRIWIVNGDVCRDLSPPIAFHQNGTIVIRKHIFAGYLYHKYLELGSRHSMSLLRRAFSLKGFDGPSRDPFAKDPGELGEKINSLADEILVLLLWHELGEHSTSTEGGEGDSQSEAFRELIMRSEDRLSEFRLRSIKDVLSDCSPGGPLSRIIEKNDPGLLYFYGALQDDTAKAMFPEMGRGILDFDENMESIEQMRLQVQARARDLYDRVVDLYNAGGPYRQKPRDESSGEDRTFHPDDEQDPAMMATLKKIRDFFKESL